MKVWRLFRYRNKRHYSGTRIIPSRWLKVGGARVGCRIGLGIITDCSRRPGPRRSGGIDSTEAARGWSWPSPSPSGWTECVSPPVREAPLVVDGWTNCAAPSRSRYGGSTRTKRQQVSQRGVDLLLQGAWHRSAARCRRRRTPPRTGAPYVGACRPLHPPSTSAPAAGVVESVRTPAEMEHRFRRNWNPSPPL